MSILLWSCLGLNALICRVRLSAKPGCFKDAILFRDQILAGMQPVAAITQANIETALQAVFASDLPKNCCNPIDKNHTEYYNTFAQVNCIKYILRRESGMKDNFDLLKLNNQVCFPLYACSKELIRQYTPYLKELDLTYTQYIVMMVLWEKESVSSKELPLCLHLDFGTLTPVLKRLEKSGYITKRRSVQDERTLDISVTEKGMELRSKAAFIPPTVAECVGLDKEEFATLYSLLNKALANMEKSNKQG